MVRVIWAGASRDNLLAELAARYAERIARRVPLRVEDIGTGRGKQPGQVAAWEERKFLAKLPASSYPVALEAGGRSFSSEKFAAWLEGAMSRAGGDLVFMIGGHEGLAPAVSRRARERLSLSTMTLTHEMARVLLLEQIYRALTILRGEPYHH
ncbi:MAG: 23S rRNA (pseudouridine(1915)-N(3))-methyltransferase RlmH [Acidobacteria bacterium]|nr:23S rRNA (pseudouridine(1915)-N(3))-methyltransferase RlmH [Acidobacteriota bacterium]